MKSYKGQLVCQHLENISRDALEDYQAVIKDYVKGRHGIYALYKKDKLYYVGLASNLRNRLKHHLRDRHAHTWDRFSVYLTIKDAHLKELESLILRIASPSGNRKSGKFLRSQDLKPVFKNAITSSQRTEINSMFGIEAGEATVKKKHGKLTVLSMLNKKFKIRMLYKGKLYKAVVRKNGSIRYKEKVYNSPSSAAQAVRGMRSNGWVWWKYERAPGDWVVLDELRRR
ncbi:MAG: hypothetical protein COX41_04220 [Candidatus Omnitrophica bacterium CG23_combo_of_CG06-09_8_20_14_all_41_10]|uniref:GIY-YIG domain-containing protein n=1 Tax=Candidatus Sherwoodlollariibacterium unditelluris TaxID=1974757 RepID=A0A2G9YKD6_9BACT|nr:MAG: hypothetical protein COX41_04220 [Candidatus Omnitrophica bacterium CG23_combo_of_CG06-09_8_20_14_all_41_10]